MIHTIKFEGLVPLPHTDAPEQTFSVDDGWSITRLEDGRVTLDRDGARTITLDGYAYTYTLADVEPAVIPLADVAGAGRKKR